MSPGASNSAESSVHPLRPVVEAALARARAQLPAEIGLACALSGEPLLLHGDLEQLTQVLASLCSVAWLSGGRQDVHVHVALREAILDEVVLDDEAAPLLGGIPLRRFARLRICSNRQDVEGAIEVRQTTAEASVSPTTNGRLGMEAIREIITAMHGTMSVQHTGEHGTTIEIYLPVVSGPLASLAVANDLPTARPAAKTWRVLYVDDYEFMRFVMAEALRDAGCEVICFERPQDALAAVKAGPRDFDLVLTDQNMPSMLGSELARGVRRIRPDLPVVIISGYDDDSLQRRALKAGARLVLKKSESLEKLCEQLLDLLEGRH